MNSSRSYFFSVGESNIRVLEIFCFYVGSEATVDFFSRPRYIVLEKREIAESS